MKVLNPFTLSFEFFPPKTPEGLSHLRDAAQALSSYDPHFFSVTFGAGGGNRSGTMQAVDLLQQHLEGRIAPHLTCIGSDRHELVELLDHYQTMGLRRVVALRGDLPSTLSKPSQFQFANELVTLIRETTGDYFHIAVAAYPEVHPQATSTEQDILSLKKKYEAGANSAITQYFFNPDAYFYYLDDCAKHSIHLPIVPGIMPITNFGKLAKFSDMCGAEVPRWLYKRLEDFQHDPESLKSYGLEVVYNLCQRLITGGAPGLHFYTLNQGETVVELVDMLGFAPANQKNKRTKISNTSVPNTSVI